jgi:hypothetical protein
MKIETLKVLEVKTDDSGKEVNVRVEPALPVKIVTLKFKSPSHHHTNEIVRALENAELTEITVTTN